MQVQTDSELLDVQFHPFDVSSDVGHKLHMAVAIGNRIKSICARAGAGTLDLVNCKITVDASDIIEVDTTMK